VPDLGEMFSRITPPNLAQPIAYFIHQRLPIDDAELIAL